LKGGHARGAGAEYGIGREGDQFHRVFVKCFGIATRIAIFYPQVAADGPTQFRQCLCKGTDFVHCFCVGRGPSYHHTDAPHALSLLRPRKRKRHRCAAETCNELPTPHDRSLARWSAS
jgi:hypothetical protein